MAINQVLITKRSTLYQIIKYKKAGSSKLMTTKSIKQPRGKNETKQQQKKVNDHSENNTNIIRPKTERKKHR